MRLKGIVFSVLLLLVTQSCNKDIVKMKIIKDCTGIYLEKNNVQHKVCNEAILDGHSAGDKVKVSYDVLEQCFGLQDPPACSESHSYTDLIDIIKIH